MELSNRNKILSFDNEVLHVIAWYASKTPHRKSLTKMAGGQREVIQSTVLSLLETQHIIPETGCSWSTIVCNHVRWVTARMIEKNMDFERLTRKNTPYYYQDFMFAERSELREAVARLADEFRGIRSVEMALTYFLGGRTFKSIAKEHKLSSERIRSLSCRGLRRLQQPSISGQLAGFL